MKHFLMNLEICTSKNLLMHGFIKFTQSLEIALYLLYHDYSYFKLFPVIGCSIWKPNLSKLAWMEARIQWNSAPTNCLGKTDLCQHVT